PSNATSTSATSTLSLHDALPICEGDRALADERRAQQPGRGPVLPLDGGVETPARHRGQRHRQRGHHPGRHHGGHDLEGRLGALREACGGEQVRRLVHRPPRSKHIIRPMITPSRTAEEPDIPVSASWSAVISAASGRPRNSSISPPTTRVVTSGMITTGISPASQRGGVSVVNHSATSPASSPVTRPPRKP